MEIRMDRLKLKQSVLVNLFSCKIMTKKLTMKHMITVGSSKILELTEQITSKAEVIN